MEGVKEKIDQAVAAFSESGEIIHLQPFSENPDQSGSETSGPVKPVEEGLFISRKRSKGDFVLVRVLNSTCFSVIHFVAIEGQVQQMEVRYINNAYELELIQRTKKLCSDGLYVELEPVAVEEFGMFVGIVRRSLKFII